MNASCWISLFINAYAIIKYLDRRILCQEKIRILREHNEKLHDHVDVLLNILKNMKEDHNSNYHDMAVKDAIKGYDEFIEEYESEMDEHIEFEDDEIDENEGEISKK
jgi:hypothetical protein